MPFTGKPDGTFTGETLTFEACAAGAPLCPRCRRVILGFSYHRPDSVLVTCKHKPTRTDGDRPVRLEGNCGQTSLVIPATGGLVFVLPVTEAMHQRLRDETKPIGLMLNLLGLLAAA